MTPKQNEEQFRRTWATLFRDGDTVELRVPKAGRSKTIAGYFTDCVAFAKAVQPVNGTFNVYVTLNPVRPDLLARFANRTQPYAEATTSDTDILCRHWLLIDLDPVRPRDISSTEEEHQCALQRAEACQQWLLERYQAKTVRADSGNGAHLLLPLDLPNDEASRDLLKKVLQALGAEFDDAQVKVDQTTFNAARITKLYGTIACKGDDTPERPHRASALLDVPDDLTPVPVEVLHQIAATLPQMEAEEPRRGRSKAVNLTAKFNLQDFMQKHCLEVHREGPYNGGTRYQLAACPFDPAHGPKDAAIFELADGKLGFHCLHDGCQGKNWQALRDHLEPDRNTGKSTRSKKSSGKRSSSAEGGDGEENDEEELTAAQLLVLIAQLNTKRFHSAEEGTAFVRFTVSKGILADRTEHEETWPVRSKAFREWLARQFYMETERVPSAQATEDALRVLEGDCRFDGEAYPMAVRVTHDPADKQTVWLDLTNPQWNAVKVTLDGWEIVEKPPILFQRFSLAAAQVAPEPDGDLKLLYQFLNVRDENARIQLTAWLIAAFLPDIAHPVLVVYGEQGSAKSTLMRMLGMLVDPLRTQLRVEPRDVGEWVQAAHHSWLVTLDNVSRLHDWLSAAICRAVTGEGFSKRMLYTDGEDVILTFRRVIALTGIEVVAQRADLLDRSILLALSPIAPDKRRSETEVLASFTEARPAILGALLDLLARVLAILPSIKLERSPRMADFARVGVAVEQALEWPSGTFLKAYAANVATQHEEAIEASVVALAVRTFMEKEEIKGEWTGTASELRDVLTKDLPGNPPRDWPKDARKLSGELTRLAPNLRAVGIFTEREREGGSGKRLICLRLVSLTEKEGESTSQVSHASLQSQTDVTLPDLFVTQGAEEEGVSSQDIASHGDDSDDSDDDLLSPSAHEEGNGASNAGVSMRPEPNRKHLDAFMR